MCIDARAIDRLRDARIGKRHSRRPGVLRRWRFSRRDLIDLHLSIAGTDFSHGLPVLISS
jgi:hypothetical protein